TSAPHRRRPATPRPRRGSWLRFDRWHAPRSRVRSATGFRRAVFPPGGLPRFITESEQYTQDPETVVQSPNPGACRIGGGMNPAPDELLILDLDSPGATLERVGCKGMSLARMARAGLPVPDGFHLTTKAYRRFIAENHLADAILAAAAAAGAADPSTFDHASAKIQSLIAKGAMPPDIAALILNSYAGLGGLNGFN